MHELKIQTLSIIAGSEACNARCPFCVSKMTPPRGMTLKEPDVDWEKFNKAALYARKHGAETTMITSKGEPLLFPNQISGFMTHLSRVNFDTIELQTNGIKIADSPDFFEPYLQEWRRNGLETISVSISHYDPEKNRIIYLPYRKSYIDLPKLINYLHKPERKFKVRLACVMSKDYIDDAADVEQLIRFAQENAADQLTIRPVNSPEESEDPNVAKWVRNHSLKTYQLEDIKTYLAKAGKFESRLPFGAEVYDVSGQNVCLTNSLTVDETDSGYLRQVIFSPDGKLWRDWQYSDEVML